jgi:hypothetical protein
MADEGFKIPGTDSAIIIPESIERVDWDEPFQPKRWFETEGLWFLPIIQVWTYDRHGGRLRGTFNGMMDAFDFGRGLLDRHDQVHVCAFDWRVILDGRGEQRLILKRIDVDETFVDSRASVLPQYFGYGDWRGFYGGDR